MPLFKIEIVESPEWPPAADDLAQRIADAVAEALDAAPQTVWVRLSTIARGDYSENGGAPADASPIFVSIIEKSPPLDAALEAEVAALTKAIAAACCRSESDIHLIYEPPGRDRVAFGGRLVS